MIAQLENKIVKWQNKVVETNNFITEPSGGFIYYDGVHRIHVYFDNGIFCHLKNVPATKYLDVSLFLIAGGGAGGNWTIPAPNWGGGGGAGGLSIVNYRIKNKIDYQIIVGKGGPQNGKHQGGNTFFIEDSSTFVYSVGGGGGDYDYLNGNWVNNGGSGGGANNPGGTPGNAQPGTPISYGNNGGYGGGMPGAEAGGGGGALTACVSTSHGGAGMTLFLYDTSAIYCAGGNGAHGSALIYDGYNGSYGSGGEGGKYTTSGHMENTPGKDGLVVIRYRYKEDLVGGDWDVVNIDVIDGNMYANYALHGGYFYDQLIDGD